MPHRTAATQTAYLLKVAVVASGFLLVYWWYRHSTAINHATARQTTRTALSRTIQFALLTFASTLIATLGYLCWQKVDFVAARWDWFFVLTACLLGLAAAIVEEVSFRFLLLEVAKAVLGKWLPAQRALWAAVALQAVLFVVIHDASSWRSALPVGMMVILLSFLRIRSNGLAAGIGVHAAWNTGQTLLFGLNKPNLPAHAGALLYAPHEEVLLLTAMLLTVVASVWAARRLPQPE